MVEQPPPVLTQKRMTDLLMLADAPWVATIIMGVSQPFAQLRDLVRLPIDLPLLVAFVVSVLIATYWVGVEQKTKPGQSLLIVPVVAMMLFSASIGANNVVKAAAGGQAASSRTQGVDNLLQQIDLLQRQLDLEKQKTAILASPTGSGPTTTSRRDKPAIQSDHLLSNAFGWRASTAYAQPPIPQPTLPADQKVKLEELDKKQKELEKQQQELKEQLLRGGSGGAHLWKSW